MKKVLCLVLSVLLVLTSSSFVFAEGHGNSKEKQRRGDVQREQVSEKNEKKKVHSEKEKRKEEIRKKVQEKRRNKDNSIPVFVKGKDVKFDVPPVVKGGRTLIPVRAVTNALGADVEWDAETKTITVSKAVYSSVYGATTTVIEIKLDSDIVLVNGKEVKIDVPAQLVNNRTMVPIRFIAQTLEQKVEWDSETGAVSIEEEEITVSIEVQIKEFGKKLKEKHKDKHVKKAIMKKLVELKKKNKDDSIPVFANGEDVKFDVPPVIKGGRTLIPVRAVTKALGADVDWNPETKTVTVTKAVYSSVYGETTTVIEINLDSDIVLVNGEEVKIDVPAQMVNNRTMVPIRFIAIVLNKKVEWDAEIGAVIIEEE
ncbi:MAG: copper amine oxidase N-terminal domain-containing protein [Bacillota bacterium]